MPSRRRSPASWAARWAARSRLAAPASKPLIITARSSSPWCSSAAVSRVVGSPRRPACSAASSAAGRASRTAAARAGGGGAGGGQGAGQGGGGQGFGGGRNVALTGTVTSVSGNTVVITTRAGNVTVTLAAGGKVYTSTPGAITNLKPGDNISVASQPGSTGTSRTASQITVLPAPNGN
ncbi:hypothetical protein [Fodinicola feengrottensis]|uniref:hypothetical protein n=1 Tax=Fodinicola feengrottensis TaxID=435914 RepID=UPI0013D13F0E|nr:hypothetical protein [Fodinicola feengrottensis]